MPDIFDELTASRPTAAPVTSPSGDIFDQLAGQNKGDVFDQLKSEGPVLRAAAPQTPITKIQDFFRNIGFGSETPEEGAARAMNIYALSKQTGIPMTTVEKHYQELARNPEITGITPTNLTNEQFDALAMLPFMGAGIAAAPATTAVSLAGYAALDKLVKLQDFLPSDASDTTRTSVEMLDFLAKGGVVGGVMKKAIGKMPSMIEKYLQTKVETINPSFQFKLTRNQVADIFQTGTLTTPEQQSLFRGLGLTRQELLQAVRKGVDIDIPGEKIVQMVDKPGWAAFKKVIGLSKTTQMFPEDPLLRAAMQSRTTVEPIAPGVRAPEPLTPPLQIGEPSAPPIAPRPIMWGDDSPEAIQFRKDAFEKALAQARIQIPDFKNSGEAAAFGQNATPEQFIALMRQQRMLQAQVNELGAQGKDSEAYYISTGAKQFNKEALKEYARKVVDNAGGHFKDIQPIEQGAGLDVYFDDPVGSTMMLPVENFTPEAVAGKIAESMQRFGISPEQAAKIPRNWRELAQAKVEEFKQINGREPDLIELRKIQKEVQGLSKEAPNGQKVQGKEEVIPKPVRIKKEPDGRTLAYFKIKIGTEWKVPVTQKMGKKTKPGALHPNVDQKWISSDDAINKIMQTLDDVKVYDKDGYIYISGYPKTPGPSGYGLAAPMAGVYKNPIENKPSSKQIESYLLRPIGFMEFVQLAKDLRGNEDFSIRRTGNALGRIRFPDMEIILTPELFERGNEQHLAITLAHEIGHLTDWLPDKTMKRGNLLGRLLTLRSFLKETLGDSSIHNKDVREELKAVSQYLHPFDREAVNKSYLSYRDSSVELYAEAVSLLFNSPGKMEELAPKFMELFFEYLDRKPEVKRAYFELMDLLNGTPTELLAKRQENLRAMFVKGNELRKQKQKQAELAKVNMWERVRQLIDDINYPIIAKRQKAESQGQFLPSLNSPEYQLEERSLVDNDQYLMISDIDTQVLKPINQAGLSEMDLWEYTFLKRIEGDTNLPSAKDIKTTEFYQNLDVGEQAKVLDLLKRRADRMDLANPQGFGPKEATEQLDFLKGQLGEEKYAVLEKSAQAFHDIVFRIVEEAQRVGSYSSELFRQVIVPNKDRYVSFGVLQYLQNFVPATVKLQKGTLKEIESPFVTTILKMVSLNRLNARQRAVNQLRDWLRGTFPGEIQPAKKNAFGGFVEPTKDSGRALIHLLEDGKQAAYEVDQYIAQSVENSKNGDIMLVGHLINKFFGNQIFKNLYITYNPGFGLAFNPIRDFKRTYANLNAMGHKVSVLSLLKTYIEALPIAVRRQKGIPDEILREMMETYALDVPFIDFNFEIQGDAYHGILKQLGLLHGEEHLYTKAMRTLLKPLIQIMEGVRFAGSVLESLTKIAAYNELKNDKRFDPHQVAYITRNYIGTPNYRRGGTITPMTNAIFIFSNIMKEGLKSDYQLATHPKTRSGFWWAHFKMNLLPKFLMYLAAAGLLGKELKDQFDKMSEYDKTNYICIPLGEDENGKAVYFRIPHDETGRLMAAVFWKTLMGIHDKDPKQLQQIFAFGAGQIPNLAPGITMGLTWMTYLTGRNPYDSFRGQYLISDMAWKAGGWPSLKKMVQWTFNNTGLLSFSTYSDQNQSTFEAVTRSIPGVNRLIKVSDYGITENLQESRALIEQKQAQIYLKKRDLIDKGVKRVEGGEKAFAVARDIARQVYNKPSAEQIQNILVSLKQTSSKGENVYFDQLMSARSNEEKILIIKKMREAYDPVTMKKLEREMLHLDLVSGDTILQSRRQK